MPRLPFGATACTEAGGGPPGFGPLLLPGTAPGTARGRLRPALLTAPVNRTGHCAFKMLIS